MADEDPRVRGDRTMADEEDEQMPFFSQFSSAGGNLGRSLDLNSNVDDFLELGSYQQLLFDQSAGHGLPPIGPGRGRPMPQGGGGRSRSLNIGGRAGSHLRPFVAPAVAAFEGGVIGRGRTVSQVTGRGVGRANASSSVGTRGKTAGKQRVSSTAASSEDVDENEGFEDEDDNNGFGEKTIAKADWTDAHITLFCNIACEEARDGHCVNGVWKSRAYNNMKKKIYQRVGLLHSTKQFKNCIARLKSYYTAWMWLGQQTGCGRTGDGAITASNEWWKIIIKERPDVRKFKGGNPEYLDMLIELFQGVAVDGSSAYVPLDEDDEEEYDVADDGNEESPMSTTSKKRGSSGGEQSASSPGKKHKSPMVKLMTGLINTINSDNTSDMITEYANKRQEAKDKAREKKSNNTKESITHCQLLAVKCGAEETSVEYFMATQLFADEANRVIFENISTDEARLTWLKRWCMMKKLY
ncbi:hypothetical protein D1007_21214 [Hordeum vulgare]|nr:hypothetical protein D1007_21214 [Hordeum vulgare]